MDIQIHGPLYQYTENDSRLIADKLKDADENEELNVYVHSPGGDIWEGKALYSLFLRHKGKVNMIGEGLVGSAASYMVMAGDTFQVHDWTEFFIHSASGIWFIWANARELEEDVIPELQQAVENLRQEDKVIADIYAKRAGIDVEKVMRWMSEDTSWYGNEIKKAGFATHLIKTPPRTKKDNLAKFDMSAFPNAAQNSKWHEKYCEGISSYQAWYAQMDQTAGGNAESDAGDAEKVRAIALAKARQRKVSLRSKMV